MKNTENTPPILGFAAYSGSGKTTLLKQLLPLLCERGICVGMIKHAHHQFEIDKPGKDSFELRKAGAQQMLITSDQRWALMVEREYEQEPKLEEHISHLEHEHLDLILIEGFKHGNFPKIEVHRPTLGKKLLFVEDPNIIAVASDSPLILPPDIVLLDLNDANAIVHFILERFLPKLSASAAQ